MTVFICFETDIRLHIPYRKIIEDVVAESLEFCNCHHEIQLSVTFTDKKGIRKLNRTFRGIDKETDVLSFPLVEYKKPATFYHLPKDDFDPATGELMLGDIVLNMDRIRSQAHEYGHSLKRELAFLTTHSMLHLMGYDHMTPEQEKIMLEKQKNILDKRGYHR